MSEGAMGMLLLCVTAVVVSASSHAVSADMHSQVSLPPSFRASCSNASRTLKLAISIPFSRSAWSLEALSHSE